MLYIKQFPKLDDVHDLRAALQQAVKLEHATIPAYLTALLSIKPGKNAKAASILRNIVIQEMLHLSIAANVLNAVGGHPSINAPDFVPRYPGPLPMGIGDDPKTHNEFIVPLKRLSRDLVHDVFMVIEEPEKPLVFPVRADAEAAMLPQFHTIGELYDALIALIKKLGPAIFTGDPGRQVTGWFSAAELFPVTSVETATAALTIIKTQGEGTRKSPLDEQGDLAHYYLYAEIYHGKTLVKDPSVPEGYSYSGAPIELDPEGIWPMVDNPTLHKLPPDAEYLANDFDYTYSSLLNALYETFNGAPGKLDTAMGVMYSLKLLGQKLIATPIDAGGTTTAGPRYWYTNRLLGVEQPPAPKAAR